MTTRTGHADLELALALNSDLMWISPELDLATWKHPEQRPMWDVLGGKPRGSLSQPGVFAECDSIKEVEAFDQTRSSPTQTGAWGTFYRVAKP